MRACSRQAWVLLALLAPVLARADFADDYIAGLAELDHGNYARAAQYLQRALDAQPDPVQRVMIEGNPQPYLPHHFLGMAKLQLGDCAEAGKEWDSAMNLRMLGRLRKVRAQEQQLLAQCKPRTAASEEKSKPPQNIVIPAVSPAPVAPSPAMPTVQTPAQPKPVAPSPPPASLVRAFDDFVAARYASAAKVDPGAVGGRARFQAYLLRSAARFALARISGNANLIEGAREDARTARTLEKSVPDERVFSPSFRAFYAAAQ
ncbi:MAG: hypothetical protein ACREPN_09620 [Rudaea sp.]